MRSFAAILSVLAVFLLLWSPVGQFSVSVNSVLEVVQGEHSTVVPSWDWSFQSDDFCWGAGVVERDDGSVIVLGNSRFIDDYWNYSLWLWCLDVDGVLLWNRCVPASNLRRAESILNSDDDGCYVAGSQGIGENSSTFVLRFNSSGQLDWNVTLSWTDSRTVSDACRLADGSLILAGDCYDPEFSFQPWVVKMNESGDILWNRTYKAFQDLGSDIITVKPSMEGGILLVGEIWDTTYGYGLAMEIDSNGDLEWAWRFEERNSAFYDMEECENGDLLFVGYSYTFLLGTDGQILVVRTDGNRTQIWRETYNIPFYGWAIALERLDSETYLLGTNEAGNYQVGFLILDDNGGIIYGLEPDFESSYLYDMIGCREGDILTVGSQGTALWIARWKREKAPTPPILLLQAVGALTGDVLLTWQPSQDSDGYITHYQLQIATQGDFANIISELDIYDKSIRLTNLIDGWYWFRVRAIDDLGGISQWSNDVGVLLDSEMALQLILGGASIVTIIVSIIAVVLYTVIQMRRHKAECG